jgi:biotin transport system substrate-specific component
MSTPAALQRSEVRGRLAVDAGLVIGASLLIAIAAQIALPMPFSPVPLTLQPLAVMFIGVTLGARRGAAAASLYLFEGICGLPVFAQAHGGAMWLLAPTAGYLYSYPFAAWVAGKLSRIPIIGMLAALVVIYAGGWSWLVQFMGARQAFLTGIAPFVIADLIKVALGALLVTPAKKLLARFA